MRGATAARPSSAGREQAPERPARSCAGRSARGAQVPARPAPSSPPRRVAAARVGAESSTRRDERAQHDRASASSGAGDAGTSSVSDRSRRRGPRALAACTGAPPSKRPRSTKIGAPSRHSSNAGGTTRARTARRAPGRPKHDRLGAEEAGPARQLDARVELDVGAVVQDRLLRQPLERAARCDVSACACARRARGAVGLRGGRRRHQRVRPGVDARDRAAARRRPPVRPAGAAGRRGRPRGPRERTGAARRTARGGRGARARVAPRSAANQPSAAPADSPAAGRRSPRDLRRPSRVRGKVADGLLPDDEHQAAVGALDGVARAGRVDDVRSGGIDAARVALRSR